MIALVKEISQKGDVWREGFPEADWRGVRAVILSEAKDLCARRARPFASLRVTGILSKYLLRKEFLWQRDHLR